MEFLDVLDSMRAEDASRARLLAEEGAQLTRSRRGADWSRRVLEAAQFIADVQRGRRPASRLREVMTTADFPLLFGDIIDRVLLSGYEECPYTWPNWCSRRTVSDFRLVNEFDVTGGEAVLSGPIGQLVEYPERHLDESRVQWHVDKYGNRMAFSFESLVNDDLGALNDVPTRFGRAARRTEERLATTMIADVDSPNSVFYTNANLNVVNSVCVAGGADNPVLGIPGLTQAFTLLGNRVDADGEPITIDAVELVVPPALEVTARTILNATEIYVAVGGLALANEQLRSVNWMRDRLRLSVNSYLPRIDGTSGNTAWYIFARPAGNRAAVRIGFLRGHEAPEIWMKEPDARRVGGGAANPLDGDFRTDSIEYKVRHIVGVAQLDPALTVASRGTAAAWP